MDHNYCKSKSDKENKKRSNVYCCVPQCSNQFSQGRSFHLFPKDTALKAQWEVVLKMGKNASKTMLVCSDNFLPSDYFPKAPGTSQDRRRCRRLFPHAVPSQNLPQRPSDKIETSQQKHQREEREKRASARQKVNATISQDSSKIYNLAPVEEQPSVSSSEPVTFVFQSNKSTQANLLDSRKYIPASEERSLADILCENSCEKAIQVNFKEREKTSQESSVQNSISLPDLLNSNGKLFTFTGIHSLDLLSGLVDCLEDLDIDARTNKKQLCLRDRIILTIVKMKLNMSFTALAVLFGTSRQTCANYFNNMCPMLLRVLKVMIPWPDQELIRNNLPLSFKNYRNTRIILDCAETVIEKCKCLKCRVLTYSQYKKNHTAKYSVGVAPSGLITDISCSFGGRASDKFIVNATGVLDKLEYNDSVMVDKGFQIEGECFQRSLNLIRPPFLRQKKQLSKEDAIKTAEIARARVHVERVIQRLREYELLRGPIPWCLAPYFDDCLIIAAGLTNVGPPIMNIDKFI